MPRKYETAVRRFVLRLIETKNQSIQHVVEFTGISKQTILRWLRDGIFDRPPQRTAQTLAVRAQPILEEMLSTTCAWTHSSMLKELENRGVKCCKRTLFSILQQLGKSRKRIKKKKRSQNATAEKCTEFKRKWIEINEDGQDIIYQDKSHYSNNLLPLYGYSQKNTPCYLNEPVERFLHIKSCIFKIWTSILESLQGIEYYIENAMVY
jgi:transposase